MTDRELLQKAIEKAIINGYPCKAENVASYASWLLNGDVNRVNHIIFSHEFAKAFWGTGTHFIECGEGDEYAGLYCNSTEEWKWQLQQMVLEEDPIMYLEKFLKP